MSAHVSREDLGRYVLQVLGPADERLVEEHVARCADCARSLQREAQLDLALGEVARRRAPRFATLRAFFAQRTPLRPLRSLALLGMFASVAAAGAEAVVWNRPWIEQKVEWVRQLVSPRVRHKEAAPVVVHPHSNAPKPHPPRQPVTARPNRVGTDAYPVGGIVGDAMDVPNVEGVGQ